MEERQLLSNMFEIGVGVKDTISASILRFVEVMKEGNADNEIKKVSKELRGRCYLEMDKYSLNAKQQGENSFKEVVVSNEDIERFKQECKNYGVDFHYEKRPTNLEELWNRKESGEMLSKTESQTLKMFTVEVTNENGEVIPKLSKDCGVITFMQKDVERVEFVAKKIESVNEKRARIKLDKAKKDLAKQQQKAVKKTKEAPER